MTPMYALAFKAARNGIDIVSSLLVLGVNRSSLILPLCRLRSSSKIGTSLTSTAMHRKNASVHQSISNCGVDCMAKSRAEAVYLSSGN